MKAQVVSGRPDQPALLQKLIRDLHHCEAFDFYVAFVTCGGITSMFQSLLEAHAHGKKGRILISDYLLFTEPEAIRRLLELPLFETRILENQKLHSKAYSFKIQGGLKTYVGSSNWTASALHHGNTELNVCVEDSIEGEFAEDFKSEFDYFFQYATPVNPNWLNKYRARYEANKSQPFTTNQQNIAADSSPPYPVATLKPNTMQMEALKSLSQLRSIGENKALIVSATGTGKTFLAAFDAKAFAPERLLFVVHRETIARKALNSFQQVFGSASSMGMFSGESKALDADFIFSTIQTISRQHNLDRFDPSEFDYIIIDETHRAGGETYQRILEHFRPQFLLGMTATPERTDGYDIYQHFDHNIGYEIRLHRALDEDMLCPFHYFGISDLTVNGATVEDETAFNLLVHPERVKHIFKAIQRYGSHDGIFRGLIFCSRIDECESLSHALNALGLRTVALSGKDGNQERQKAINRLESDGSDRLDFIISVDIFNEGVDIPKANMILMLRPTQSSIVFIQQLGRGLRKTGNPKKFLTVIDFIGNYTNNFMIPMALYGDQSHDKDKLRRLVSSEGAHLPGLSTVQFDAISKARVFQSINDHVTKLNDLRKDWNDLRLRLGRTPWMIDFLEHSGRHPMAFADYSNGYRNFLTKMDSESHPPLNQQSQEAIKSWTRHALNGTSIEEPVIALQLLQKGMVNWSGLSDEITQLTKAHYTPSLERLQSAANALNLQFDRMKVNKALIPIGEAIGLSVLKTMPDGIIPEWSNLPGWNDDSTHLRKSVEDLAAFALREALSNESEWRQGLVRYRKYDRADVFRILGTRVNPVAQNVGGYQVQNDQWCPIFVTYHKSEDISASTQYEDRFMSPKVMHYFTKSNRSLTSPDVQFFKKSALSDAHHLPLFVKKDDDEGISFYYVGDVRPDPDSFAESTMQKEGGGSTPVVTMDLILDQPVKESLYDYLISDS